MNAQCYIVDGFPMMTAHFKRANKSNNFKGEAGYGFCASKSETYYGHLDDNHAGVEIGVKNVIADGKVDGSAVPNSQAVDPADNVHVRNRRAHVFTA